MVLGNEGSMFFLEYPNTHTWVWILLVLVHGMCTSRMCLKNGRKVNLLLVIILSAHRLLLLYWWLGVW